jgi:hypothetical protein
MRMKREKAKGTESNTPDEEHGMNKWEKCEYPFVKLEDNCAPCALMNLEEYDILLTVVPLKTTMKRKIVSVETVPRLTQKGN